MKSYSRLLAIGGLLLAALCTVPTATGASAPTAGDPVTGLFSIDTGYTILKVRAARMHGQDVIVAASYEGTVMAFDYSGNRLWLNELSGYMVHDLWCADLDGDGSDETLAANADGGVYCLNVDGSLRWPEPFRPTEAPMYAVCVVHDRDKPYIVCGGFDLNAYYVDADGGLVDTIRSTEYSQQKTWGTNAPSNRHTVNFLRPRPIAAGGETLLLAGTNNHMQSSGVVYEFTPLATLPLSSEGRRVSGLKTLGDLHVCDPDGDGNVEILMGSSQHVNSSDFAVYHPDTGAYTSVDLSRLRRKINRSHYLVVQPRTIREGGSFRYFLLMGPAIVLIEPGDIGLSADALVNAAEFINGSYSYNDIWQVDDTTFLLASAQSGGSCVHVLDTSKSGWKGAFQGLEPIGKLAEIHARRAQLEVAVDQFVRPDYEANGRDRPVVYFMTESLSGSPGALAEQLERDYSGIEFFTSPYTNKVQYPPSWDRDTVITNAKYRDKRDRRHDYDDPAMDQQGIVSIFAPDIDSTNDGVAYWGGHGNDPLFFSLDTRYELIDRAFDQGGKKTVMIFPEMGDYSADFEWVLDNMFAPLAEYSRTRNANIFVRSKNIFWIGHVYRKSTKPESDAYMWDLLMSGKYASVFVPAMEETTDKTMELSYAGRVGLWASGAVNSWGTRCARDNPSYDRSRQHSNQMLPNHFLTNMVFHIASGAQYINNFAVDQEYMSILWKLIARGALFVPYRDEILSFNPVHLSMTDPDDHFMEDGEDVKWTVYWDEEKNAEPMVFSRMNGSWPAAPTTPWDYSRYAAGVQERRLSFISPQPNGLVLITPPQDGAYAVAAPARGKLRDKLHPFYRNILKEYITNGRDYLAADGSASYSANGAYFEQIRADIEAGSKQLPLTVAGDLGWVVAQSSPRHLRLTLVDTGYINPKERTATVRFQTVTPVMVRDVLDGQAFEVLDGVATIPVPLGSFRFIDIELAEPFFAPAESASVLSNISTRAVARGADGAVIPGFVLEGSGTRRVLIRAVGPKLQDFGVGGTLPDPLLSVYLGESLQMTNNNWTDPVSGYPAPGPVMEEVGAFSLHAGPGSPTEDSLSAAIAADLAAGAYSAHARDVVGRSGVVLVEIYDAGSGLGQSRIVNISNRGFVGTGEEVMIPGIVVSSDRSQRFLIRAAGQKLADFGVPSDLLLADPSIRVIHQDVEIASNDDWVRQNGTGVGDEDYVETITSRVGAFSLRATAEFGSDDEKSAALVVDLDPGIYSIVVSGAADESGITLAEVYAVQ